MLSMLADSLARGNSLVTIYKFHQIWALVVHEVKDKQKKIIVYLAATLRPLLVGGGAAVVVVGAEAFALAATCMGLHLSICNS